MFGIRVRGNKETADKMKSRRQRLSDPTTANKAAAVLLYQWVQKNFQAEGDLHDNPRFYWPPLSDKTIANRRKSSGRLPAKILQDTGRLKSGFVFEANRERGRLLNAVKYAALHENGKPGLPQRKIFPSIEQGRKIALPAYEKFVNQAIR